MAFQVAQSQLHQTQAALAAARSHNAVLAQQLQDRQGDALGGMDQQRVDLSQQKQRLETEFLELQRQYQSLRHDLANAKKKHRSEAKQWRKNFDELRRRYEEVTRSYNVSASHNGVVGR